MSDTELYNDILDLIAKEGEESFASIFIDAHAEEDLPDIESFFRHDEDFKERYETDLPRIEEIFEDEEIDENDERWRADVEMRFAKDLRRYKEGFFLENLSRMQPGMIADAMIREVGLEELAYMFRQEIECPICHSKNCRSEVSSCDLCLTVVCRKCLTCDHINVCNTCTDVHDRRTRKIVRGSLVDILLRPVIR